jgi:serine/threonine protein kinase
MRIVALSNCRSQLSGICGSLAASCVQLAPGLDPVGLNLLEGMLDYDPCQRISADAALQHPWFADVQLPLL